MNQLASMNKVASHGLPLNQTGNPIKYYRKPTNGYFPPMLDIK